MKGSEADFCGLLRLLSTVPSTAKHVLSSGAPQPKERTLRSSYTPVIRGAICDKVRVNEVLPALRKQPGSVADTCVEGADGMDVTESEGEYEARLRLAAIGVWAQQGIDGRCSIPVALTAITGLAVAADRFLAKPAA